MTVEEQRLAGALNSGGISSKSVYRLFLQQVKVLGLKGAILELGAGKGLLTPRLLHPDRALTCVDLLPRPESVHDGVLWIQADLNQPLPLPDHSFDAIIATEVIHYLENPRAFARELHRLLKPGGTLLLTQPNQESIRSFACLIFGGHFAFFLGKGYPGAITPLLRLDFQRICAETGFAPPTFYYTNEGGLPKLPHLTWQRLLAGLPKGRLFSDNVGVHTQVREEGLN